MLTAKKFTRRNFIKQSAAAGGLLLATGCRSILSPRSLPPGWKGSTLRFGVISDVHLVFHPDADARLTSFVEEMNRRKVDFIIQLGDFCHGYAKEKREKFDGAMRRWNSFLGPKYHVLGNHDVEACSKKEILEYWGMERSFYSFDMGGYHFVILDGDYLKFDGEYKDYDKGNYRNSPNNIPYVSAAELDWLTRDLAATHAPTILFSHYGLGLPESVRNADEVRAVLEHANKEAGFRKVVASLCGHYHKDRYSLINGIHYIEINSATYYWLGGKWRWIKYKDPLYATVTLKPGRLDIEGRKSRVVPSWAPGQADAPVLDKDVTAQISSRYLRF